MTQGELRRLILSVIDARRGASANDLYEHVSQKLGKNATDSDDRRAVSQAIWELIAQQVLIPGPDASKDLLNNLMLTDYGREVFERVRYDYLPYDPDGYLREIGKRVRGLKETARMYLAESLQAFNRCLPLASAVMLGAASEDVFLQASDALMGTLHGEDKSNYEELAKKRNIKALFDKFREHVDVMKRRGELPRPIKDTLEADWDGIFHLIRNNRNDAGHPARPNVTLGDARCGLVLFPQFCERALALRRFLRRKAKQHAAAG